LDRLLNERPEKVAQEMKYWLINETAILQEEKEKQKHVDLINGIGMPPRERKDQDEEDERVRRKILERRQENRRDYRREREFNATNHQNRNNDRNYRREEERRQPSPNFRKRVRFDERQDVNPREQKKAKYDPNFDKICNNCRGIGHLFVDCPSGDQRKRSNKYSSHYPSLLIESPNTDKSELSETPEADHPVNPFNQTSRGDIGCHIHQ